VRRPGLGREGKRMRVRANFFEVLQLPQTPISHYDVTITPDVPPQLNRKVFEKFVEDNRNGALGNNTRPVYDGRKNMFVHKELPFGDAYTFDVSLPEDDGAVARRRPPRDFKLKLKRAGSDILMSELQSFLDGRNRLTKKMFNSYNGT